MSHAPIKARPASQVAGFLAEAKPDLVISIGEPLPEAAREFVRSGDAPTAKSRHLELLRTQDGLLITEDGLQLETLLKAAALDEAFERQLGRPPRILTHCLNGETRSVLLCLALYAAREIRAEPERPVTKILESVRDRVFDFPSDETIFTTNTTNVERSFPLTLRKLLNGYQQHVQAREASAPVRPAARQADVLRIDVV